MRRNFLLTLAATVSLPLLSACGAALGWVGAVTGAIEVARALLGKVMQWVGTYRNVPGIPTNIYSEIDELISDVTGLLDQAEKTARKGGEFQEEAEALYKLARKTLVDRLLKLLESVGMFSSKSTALVQPAGSLSVREDGTSDPPAMMAVELPPEKL